MPIPFKLLRGITLAIPLFTALLLLGAIQSFFGIDLESNIANSGIKLRVVFGLLCAWLWFLIFKHRVP